MRSQLAPAAPQENSAAHRTDVVSSSVQPQQRGVCGAGAAEIVMVLKCIRPTETGTVAFEMVTAAVLKLTEANTAFPPGNSPRAMRPDGSNVVAARQNSAKWPANAAPAAAWRRGEFNSGYIGGRGAHSDTHLEGRCAQKIMVERRKT